MNRLYKKKTGFTLLELIIVIVIIGILAMLALPRFFDAIEQARAAEGRGTLHEIFKFDQAYFSLTGSHLTSIQEGQFYGVDLDNDGTDDIQLGIPASPNFEYSISGTDAIAARQGNTRVGWQIDLTTGSITTY